MPIISSSGPLGALLSSPVLDVRLPTALQVLQVPPHVRLALRKELYDEASSAEITL